MKQLFFAFLFLLVGISSWAQPKFIPASNADNQVCRKVRFF